MRLSPHVFQDYIKNFGFGSRPDSGLAAEAPGKLLPSKKWTAVDHASISFGQGILVSPLQMLVAINVFANRESWSPLHGPACHRCNRKFSEAD